MCFSALVSCSILLSISAAWFACEEMLSHIQNIKMVSSHYYYYYRKLSCLIIQTPITCSFSSASASLYLWFLLHRSPIFFLTIDGIEQKPKELLGYEICFLLWISYRWHKPEDMTRILSRLALFSIQKEKYLSKTK